MCNTCVHMYNYKHVRTVNDMSLNCSCTSGLVAPKQYALNDLLVTQI